jgi:hypothetical protein
MLREHHFRNMFFETRRNTYLNLKIIIIIIIIITITIQSFVGS